MITLGADVGGRDAHAATRSVVSTLRAALQAESSHAYGEKIRSVDLVLRIDGDVQAWGKEGVDNIRFQSKSQNVTADMFVPKKVWFGATEATLRTVLGEWIKVAIDEIVRRAIEKKLDLNAEQLRADVRRALAAAAG